MLKRAELESCDATWLRERRLILGIFLLLVETK